MSAICDVVADENHFVPNKRNLPRIAICAVPPSADPATAFATVSEIATSEPPVRSVIHCPLVHALAGSRDVSRGSARSTSAELPDATSVRPAPSVIASGHE